MSDLAADERDALAETLEDWQRHLEEYGVDDGFHVAFRALQARWDDPALAAVLAGKGRSWPPPGTDEEEPTAVRLQVLEACDRTDEYLNLARGARAHTSYAAMLAKLERTKEAVKHALKWFKRPDQALALTKVLRESAAQDHVLKIADTGLGLAEDDDDDTAGSVALAPRLRGRDWEDGAGSEGREGGV